MKKRREKVKHNDFQISKKKITMKRKKNICIIILKKIKTSTFCGILFCVKYKLKCWTANSAVDQFGIMSQKFTVKCTFYIHVHVCV